MKISTPGSHADHMLRQTRMHHVQLSSMADAKANILLTTSLLIIPLLIRYLDDELLRWPTVNMLAFCLLTALLAAYVVMPHVPLSVRRPKAFDLTSERFNVLFFGDFLHMQYAQYQAAMEEVLQEPGRTYEAQVREIYLLGEFLGRKKYRFLRLAYLTLLFGLISSTALVVWFRF